MTGKLKELARRKEDLVSRSARKREELARSFGELRESMSFVRGIFGLLQTLVSHPALTMGLTALMVSARQGKGRQISKRLGLFWRFMGLLRSLWLARRAEPERPSAE